MAVTPDLAHGASVRGRPVAGPIAYGLLFSVALPLALVAWARSIEPHVGLPGLRVPSAGAALIAGGVALVVAGWASLWIYARGLPMNAYPPARLVVEGAYRLLDHPIYVGFCAAVLGAALWSGSASGLWIVFPVVCLLCAGLVFGYEGRDLRERLGERREPPLLVLPPASDAPALPRDRAALLVLVALPFLLLYGAAGLAATAYPDKVATYLPFERRWPVFEWAEAVYASIYAAAALAPLAPRSRSDARRLVVRGLLAHAIVFPFYFALPLVAPPRPFEPGSFLGALLQWERDMDTPAAAFPSFHVVFALLIGEAFAARWPRLRHAFRGWAVAVAASCVLTGMHSLLDVLAGGLAFAAVVRARALWERLRAIAQRLANGWREWRVGPVRIINHGAWAGLGNAVALAIVALMVGPGHAHVVVAAATMGLLGSLIWAQLVERPPPAMRPFGFYGGLFGIMAAAAAWPLFGGSADASWELLAGFCCAAPFVQSLGRVRCLVQGCCHGAPAPAAAGIVVTHERSRVVKAGLGGVPLHPTQLYSILWNALVAVAVLRLWSLHVPAHFLGGFYLVLSGIGRFVEEGFRGEPQTPIVGRLRIYQWVALATIAGGAAIMGVASSAPLPWPRISPSMLIGIPYGVLTWLALGVDVPGSARRFARLE